jgi:hypothetical protein
MFRVLFIARLRLAARALFERRELAAQVIFIGHA